MYASYFKDKNKVLNMCYSGYNLMFSR